MAHDLLTRESPEITQFFQDIGHITELLKSEPDRYRPVLNGWKLCGAVQWPWPLLFAIYPA